MTDREILRAIGRHCDEAAAERAKLSHPFQSFAEVAFMCGYYGQALQFIRDELSHMRPESDGGSDAT